METEISESEKVSNNEMIRRAVLALGVLASRPEVRDWCEATFGVDPFHRGSGAAFVSIQQAVGWVVRNRPMLALRMLMGARDWIEAEALATARAAETRAAEARALLAVPPHLAHELAD